MHSDTSTACCENYSTGSMLNSDLSAPRCSMDTANSWRDSCRRSPVVLAESSTAGGLLPANRLRKWT